MLWAMVNRTTYLARQFSNSGLLSVFLHKGLLGLQISLKRG